MIEDSAFRGSRGVGVFVDGYVEGVTLRDSQVDRRRQQRRLPRDRVAAQPRSRATSIRANGYRENGPGGQPFTFQGIDLWFWGVGREGISVDGSYENTIAGNAFLENSAGGIFLYKNCGEYPDRPAYFERRYPSEHNLIEGNTFLGGTNGVWVGSRMGENTLPMDCTDPAYVDEPLPPGGARPGQRQHGARPTGSSTSPTASGSRTTATASRPTRSRAPRPTATRSSSARRCARPCSAGR